MDIKDESLKKALALASILELPKQQKGDSGEYWLEAIVLVRKYDDTQSYALAKRGADSRIRYVADFGTMSPIAGLVSIHPYLYLDKARYMPYETPEQKKIALIEFIGDDDEARKAVGDMSDEEIGRSLLQTAIDMQYSNKATNVAHDRILAVVKGISSDEEVGGEEPKDVTDDGIEDMKPKRVSTRRMPRTKKND